MDYAIKVIDASEIFKMQAGAIRQAIFCII